MRIPVHLQAARLEEQLRERLQFFPPGKRFLSIRKMEKEFGCSRRVIQAALRSLAAKGIVEVHPNQGIFNSLLSRRDTPLILVLSSDYPIGDTPDWPSWLARQGRESGRFELSVQHYDHERNDFINYDLSRVDAVILNICPESFGRNHMQWILSQKVPVVMVNFHPGDVPLDSVFHNDALGGLLAAQCLLRHGHRRLAVLICEPHSQAIHERSQSFKLCAEQANAEVEIIDCKTRSGETSRQRGFECLEEHLRKSGCNFTALFVLGDAAAAGALAALAAHNLRVPNDVSVIGYDGLPVTADYSPPLTTIDLLPQEYSQALLDVIFRRLAGEPGPIHYEIIPRLILRDSVQAIAPGSDGI